MRLFLFCTLFFAALIVSAQQEPFSYLEKITINTPSGIFIKYNKALSEVYNTKFKDLDKNDSFYPEGGPAFYNTKLIKTKIDQSSDKQYYVVYSSGPSGDPQFMFYKTTNTEMPVFRVMALKVYIPGNGNIYVSGHTNNAFNMRRKYKVVNDELVETEQPFYYVGMKTKTLKPINLFASREFKKKTAYLPANYSIEVLLNEKGTAKYLIKTDFGLTGWVDLGSVGMMPDKIDKLYYAGD